MKANPAVSVEAWIATVPQPCAALLFGLGLGFSLQIVPWLAHRPLEQSPGRVLVLAGRLLQGCDLREAPAPGGQEFRRRRAVGREPARRNSRRCQGTRRSPVAHSQRSVGSSGALRFASREGARRLLQRVQASVSSSPAQFLQNRASASCPSVTQCGHTRVVTTLPLTA